MADASESRLRPVDFDFWWPARPELGWQVLGLRGHEEISRPYEFEIELVCDDPSVDPEQLLAADCELLLERNGLTRVIFGVVAEVELGLARERELDGVVARVSLVPAFRLLDQEIDTRFFMGQTVIEILRDRLGAALARFGRELDVESRIVHPYNRRDYCVQFRESTFDFCNRIMEEEGIAYVFVADHEGQRERMVLVDDNEGYAPAELVVPGAMPIAATAAEELDRESIQSFDWRRRRTPNRVVARGYNYKNPDRLDDGEAERDPAGRAVTLEHYRHGEQRQIIDDLVDDPEAQQFTGAALDQRASMAARLLARHAVEGQRGRGRANAIGFVAGGLFELGEALEATGGEQRFVIVRVEHHGEVREQLAAASSAYQNRFECVAKSQPFRPARRTPRPRVYGVQTGVVVGRTADEVYTDALGRVRVKFHHDRSEVDGEHASCWIRVAQMWAGNGYGTMIIPRVGMEVVVSFVDGDPDCPLVTGSVYHARNTPPYSLPDELSKSTIKTRSTPGGEGFNELRLEDERGREQIFVHAQGRMDLRVRGVLFETSVGAREQLIGSADSGMNDVLDGSHNVWVRGYANHVIGFDDRSEVGGEVGRTVQEQVVEDYLDNHFTFVGKLRQLNAERVVVEATEGLSHKAAQVELAASTTLSMLGGERVVVQSNNRIELVVGQSFIAVTPTGVEIGGESIRLNSGGAAIGRAKQGVAAQPADVPTPIKALAADDGRPGSGGGGSGRGRILTSRTVEPKHAPPIAPMKPTPTRPERKPEGTRRIVLVMWGEAEAWCSEPAQLWVNSERYDGSVAETVLIDNEVDGVTQCVDVVRPAAPTERFSVEITDVVPRKIGEAVELERALLGSVGGVTTPVALRLRFLAELPSLRYTRGRSRFDVAVRNHEVVVGGTIQYKRGWIHYIVRLGTLVDAEVGGLIGGSHYGSDDWRYCKIDVDAGGEEKLVYWNGSAWVDLPAGLPNSMGTRLYGMAVWREGAKVETQFGTRDWPDPVAETWADDRYGEDLVPEYMDYWSAIINEFWTGKFDIIRNECRGHDAQCCRYRVRCEVRFAETASKQPDGIIVAQNYARANASVWPYDEDDVTLAHEFGHHLGNPDEYPGAGSVDPTVNGDGAKAGIDDGSIMGAGETMRRRHLKFVCWALAEAVAKHTGKHYTYSPAEPA